MSWLFQPLLQSAAALASTPSGTPAVLEDFEATPNTGLYTTWTPLDLGGGAATVTRTTSHVTQGTYTWRIEAVIANGYGGTLSAVFDVTPYDPAPAEFKVDVYSVTLDAADVISIWISDDGFSTQDTASSTPGQTGAFTLTVTPVNVTDFTNLEILIVATNADLVNVISGNCDFYVDNLRTGDIGGGGFLSAFVYNSNSVIGGRMKKNVAGQKIGSQMVSATDGSAFTSAVTVYVTGDAGTQAVGSVGAGACTHEGNGYHTYAPAQAETNYDLIGFTFIGTGAVPSSVQVYTGFPQTGDAFTTATAIEVDTQDIQARLPAALVSGRIDASVGAMAANVLTATAINADAITAAKVAADVSAEFADAVWDEDATGHQTQGTFGQAIGDPVADTNTIYKAVVSDATGATVGVDVVAIKAETVTILADTNDIQTRIPAALVSGRMDASVGAMATDVITNTALAASAVTEIQSGLSTLTSANVSAAVWDAATASYGTAGTYGLLVETNLDAAITTRMATYTQPTGFLAATFPGTVASTTNITAGTITTTTNLTNLPTIPANWLTAAGTAADFTTEIQTGLATSSAVSTLQTSVDDLPTNGELTTALSGLATAANLATVDTVVDAIKVKTDSLTFTVPNTLDSNITKVNGYDVTGDGNPGTEWGP